jgi:2-phosphoglycerate kinase
MACVFISGIPASGKSYLSKKIARVHGVLHVSVDGLRERAGEDPQLKPYLNFFRLRNEAEYWSRVSCAEHWQNLKRQSEALWPAMVGRINCAAASGRPVIFEGVNILPHLAARDLRFSGIVLLGESLEAVFQRNRARPRWGKAKGLQRRGAEAFFFWEREFYRSEAEKYGYQTFTSASCAEPTLLRMLEIRFDSTGRRWN